MNNCYYRDEYIDEINIDDGNFDNPNKCNIKREAYCLSQSCYMTSSGSNRITKNGGVNAKLTYYDMDIDNNRVLTEWGWCDYEYDILDANWMSHINPDLKINQINIPGTHDSGTYDIAKVWKNTNYFSRLISGFTSLFKEPTARTQSLSISEQLINGIRYFDIRLDLNNKTSTLYLTHNGIDCYDSYKNDYLYFESVIQYCVDFLRDHPSETIILHLKKENNAVNSDDNKIAKLIESVLIKDEYEEFIYVPWNIDKYYTNNYIPILKDVRRKIVFFSRSGFKYTNIEVVPTGFTEKKTLVERPPIGYLREIEDKGRCSDISIPFYFTLDDNICRPEERANFRYQDDYQLSAEFKQMVIYNMLIEDSEFNDPYNNSTHTLNFMNIAFTTVGAVANSINTIKSSATYMNKWLSDFLKKYSAPNEWFVLDFPTTEVIRTIYNTNFDNNKFINNFSSGVSLDKICPKPSFWEDVFYYFLNPIPTFSLDRRDSTNDTIDINSIVCLQRKIITDEQGNQHDLVKTNYKCIDNSLSKWRIKQNNDGKYYSIISAYDDKCLNYSGDALYMQECKDNNKYQKFTIKDDIICILNDETKCLNNYNIYPTALEPKEYENLSCSTNFASFGVKCCSDKNIQVEYVDEIGNWGIENGELCGIGYKRCSFSVLGFNCCSSVNPEVVFTDEYGSWGIEDGQWCGIDEAIFDSRFRIRNKKTKQCLVTDLNSDTTRIMKGDCDATDYSLWNYSNNELILAITGKCLYAMNSQTSAMTECDNTYTQIDNYKYFNIIDNKYICVKNDADPNQYCLNGKSLNFETSKDEYSEWEILKLNTKIVDSIGSVIENNPNLSIGIFKPTTTTRVSTSTNEPISECNSKAGYPCCSLEITEIIYTDEEGNWGSENNDWCLITDSTTSITTTTTTTTTVEPTSDCYIKTGYPCCSSENAEVYQTDENGNWGYENDHWCLITETISTPTPTYAPTPTFINDDVYTEIYYLYNPSLNKCIYTSGKLGTEITLAEYDHSENSHWIIPGSHNGKIRSKVNPDYCIVLSDNSEGTLILGECESDKTIFYSDSENNSILSSSTNDKCIGVLNSNSTVLVMNKCNKNIPDQKFYFNLMEYETVNPTTTSTTVKKTTTTTTKKTSTTSNASTPTINPKLKPVWLYNKNLNQCLTAQATADKKPIVKDCGQYTNHKWYIDPYPKGYVRPKSYPERCITVLDAPNGKIKISNCTINNDNSNIFELTDEGLIKSTLTNECLGKGDKLNDPTNAKGGYLKSCTKADDQLWQMWERFPYDIVNAQNKTVWIYNPKLNKCVYPGSVDRNRPYIGNCNCNKNNKINLWSVPVSSEGFYKSEDNKYCFTVSEINDGTVINTSCSEKSIIGYNESKNSIYSTLNKKKCLGLLSNNKTKLNFNDCDTEKDDQYWKILETCPN